MTQGRLDRTQWMLISSAVGFVGAAVAAAFLDTEAPEASVLLGLCAAVIVMLATFRQWIRQRDRLFIHGYHAGFHAGQADLCQYPSCDVLPLAERRAPLTR